MRCILALDINNQLKTVFMVLLWIGIAIFIIGVIVRNIYKIRYYNDAKENAHTDLQRQEIKSFYRPKIFIGLGIEVLGVIVIFLSLLLNN